MSGRRSYERQLAELAERFGATLGRGGKHYKLLLPGGLVVPAAATPSRLNGGRPVKVEAALRRALARGRTA